MKAVQKIARRTKKIYLGLHVAGLKREGFSAHAARLWKRETLRELKAHSPLQWATLAKTHRSGYTKGFLEKVKGAGHSAEVSQRDYYSIFPINPRRVWLSNRVVARKEVAGLRDVTPHQFCTIFTYDDRLDIVRLLGFPRDLEASEAGLLELIRAEENLRLVPVRWNRGLGRLFSWDESGYAIDGWPASEKEVFATIAVMTRGTRCVLERYDDKHFLFGAAVGCETAYLRVYLGKDSENVVSILNTTLLQNDRWQHAKPSPDEVQYAKENEGVKRGWSRRRTIANLGEQRFESVLSGDSLSQLQDLDETQRFIPRVHARLLEVLADEVAAFRYLAVDVAVAPDGSFSVHEILPYVAYTPDQAASSDTQAFLAEIKQQHLSEVEESANRKEGALLRKMRRFKTKYRAFSLRARGYSGRMAKAWVAIENQAPKHRVSSTSRVIDNPQHWGFSPATVRRFKVNRKNVDSFISERDYFFANPLNGKYAKWVRDRVSARTVFAPFDHAFENAHYQFLRRGTDLHIIALSEEAQAFSSSIEGIAALIQKHGSLNLVSSAWVGDVSLTVKFDGEVFTVDERIYSADEFEKLLTFRVRRQFYVLVEPATQDIENGHLSTIGDTEIQVLMVNPDGATPRAVEAAVLVHEPTSILTDEVLQQLKITAKQARAAQAESQADSLEAEIERSEHREDSSETRESLSAENDEIDIEIEEGLLNGRKQNVTFTARLDTKDGTVRGAILPVGPRLLKLKKHPVTQEPFNATVESWNEITELLHDLCVFAPQLDFVRFSLRVTSEGIKITGISALPPYHQTLAYTPETVSFLKNKLQLKTAASSGLSLRAKKWGKNFKLKVRKQFAQRFYPAGLVPYQSVRWLGDVRRDLFERNGVDLRTKFWAYKHGFLSYRLPQYGITPANRTEFISDFEYRWLRHINKKYKYWLEDKISIKYVAAHHNECLPGYYFYTTSQGDKSVVVPMMDCPEGYDASYEDIIRLAREKGVLALKPDEGSHGEGFYKLTVEDGEFYLNGQLSSETAVLEILKNPANEYLITEFIEMHPELALIYPYSVNTIRMIVFKKDGVTPTLGNTYLRIGSLKSGYVDNTAAGGMLAEIDAETGRYGNAQILENGRVTPCPSHPDTGVLIEGVIPNWEYAKQKVLQIAADLPQLEYLGFDLAITPEGFKLPEINRSPDYPRIDKLTPETIDYLLYKLREKKHFYGYDRNPPKTLISLPPRDNA